MANKNFVVQYVIKAREKFAAAAGRVAKSSALMSRGVDAAKKSIAFMTDKANKARASLKRLAPSLKKINALGLKAEAAYKKLGDRFKGVAFLSEKIRSVGIAGSIAVTLPAVLMARSFKNAARDAVETRSKFKTVFKDIAAQAESSADSLSKNFGITGTAARKLVGDTGDLLTGLGFTQKSALKLSNQVNELAVDLASFTNFSGGAEGASAALTKALLGERESIKSLGIAINEKDVKQKIATLVSKGARFSSLKQAKAQATLALAVEQSKNAIGDFARTQGELANQERITSARIQDLKESMGSLLLPAALKLTKAIRSIVVSMTEMSPTAKKALLIFVALVSVLGPLLLIIGTIGLALPALAAGFALVGVAVKALATVFVTGLSPAMIIIAALAGAAFLIISNWETIEDFFSGIADAIIDKWQAVKDFFVGIVSFVQNSVAPVIEAVSAGLNKVGEVKASISSFFGGGDSDTKLASVKSTVDTSLTVSLAEGLQQSGKAKTTSSNTRRSDVGVAAAGA